MERNCTTQMDAARRGILPPELETVARKEQMRPEELMPLVAEGKVAIPANRLHSCLDAPRRSTLTPELETVARKEQPRPE